MEAMIILALLFCFDNSCAPVFIKKNSRGIGMMGIEVRLIPNNVFGQGRGAGAGSQGAGIF